MQSVSYLCNAYAVECIRGSNFDMAETLLARAEELIRKPVTKKCVVMKFLRAGLRAATFNTRADLYRHKGQKEKAFRALQQALKVGALWAIALTRPPEAARSSSSLNGRTRPLLCSSSVGSVSGF